MKIGEFWEFKKHVAYRNKDIKIISIVCIEEIHDDYLILMPLGDNVTNGMTFRYEISLFLKIYQKI